MMAISAFRFWLAGGDGVRVGEDGHAASHRPNRAAPALAKGRYEGGTGMVSTQLMAALPTLLAARGLRAGALR
jgi:hypothetical protein